MSAPWSRQSGFAVRFGWGPGSVAALADAVSTVVLVDVLRFTTALDVATAAGAAVHPAPWPFEPGPAARDAEVADGSGPRRLSLSPATLSELGPGDRIVLPSANGSHCSAVASSRDVAVVGACLRNAVAVAAWLRGQAAPVAVIACGERWPDGGLRPAVEDLVGAGAVVAALSGEGDGERQRVGERQWCSPEAAVAEAAFRAVADALEPTVANSESGRELVAKGLADDVAWAGAWEVSVCVPLLCRDGAYRAASNVHTSTT